MLNDQLKFSSFLTHSTLSPSLCHSFSSAKHRRRFRQKSTSKWDKNKMKTFRHDEVSFINRLKQSIARLQWSNLNRSKVKWIFECDWRRRRGSESKVNLEILDVDLGLSQSKYSSKDENRVYLYREKFTLRLHIARKGISLTQEEELILVYFSHRRHISFGREAHFGMRLERKGKICLGNVVVRRTSSLEKATGRASGKSARSTFAFSNNARGKF